MNTLIISSSLSSESKSYILAKKVEEQLDSQITVTFVDLREYELQLTHKPRTKDMDELSELVRSCDNIIFATGIYNYSISDSLKLFIDTCLNKENSKGKFYGIVCAAGGDMSYLASMQLTQMCQNHNKMIQLPEIIYASSKDFTDEIIQNQDVLIRITDFCERFKIIGKKLL